MEVFEALSERFSKSFVVLYLSVRYTSANRSTSIGLWSDVKSLCTMGTDETIFQLFTTITSRTSSLLAAIG